MERSPWAFIFPYTPPLFLLPSSPLFYWAADVNPLVLALSLFLILLLLTVYLGPLVLKQSSCDGEAPLQLLHLNLWVLHLRNECYRRSRIQLWKMWLFPWLILLLPSVSLPLSFPCNSVFVRG
jgi:hypothetical protein